ncbi:unnamed protein product [Aureobasidium uvarum]|uniref:Myb-like domain-containing protein n=1 Tax=Aureobasidium uvarum TaxID=2773716 RepID=A0A9N8KEJ9_9PEZI|nr:unnamed protein product [Aureobasidium uvarum]
MARTRSQSREPGVEPRLVHRQIRTVGGGTAHNARQAQQQLEPLTEDMSEVEEDLEDDFANDSEDMGQQSAASEDEEVSNPDSAPIVTFSQTELQQLDPVQMENNIEELNAQARKLLGCFKTRTGQPNELQSLIRESQDPESRQRQKLDACWSALEETQAIFTRGGEYLKLNTILRGLLRKRSTQRLPKAIQPWRPDDVICKANLAILVHAIIIQSTDEDFTDALVPLDSFFPSSFVVGFANPGIQPRAGYSTLVPETFEFALELRTQILVAKLLTSDPTQDAAADDIRRTMLNFDETDDFDDEMGAMQNLQSALSRNIYARKWDLLDPRDFGTDEYADKIIRRTEEIKRVLFSDIEDPFVDTSASLESGLARLRDRFPRERFQKYLLQWSNSRLSEIDNSIKRLGGIDEIVTALEDEIRQRLENPDAYVDEGNEELEALPSIESNIRPEPTSRGRPGTSASAPTPAIVPVENTAQVDEQATDNVASTAGPTQDRPKLTGQLARANALDEQQRQQRRFIDAQPNGVRISDDLFDSQPAPSAQRQTSGKPEIEIDPILNDEVQDPSEDEGFQVDQRNLPGNRPRPGSSAVPSQAPAGSTVPERRRRRTSEGDSPNKRQRKNPGQLMPPFQSTDDEDVNGFRLASVRTRQLQASTVKPQRGRRPWTDDEVGALLRLIRDHGISFAYIKRIDKVRKSPALGDRTAEDIRFKAREMKVKYLIAERQLPENLGLVPLGKKEIEKVNQYVPYEQEPQRSRARVPSISPEPSSQS